MTEEKLNEMLKVTDGTRVRELLSKAIDGILDGSVSAEQGNAVAALGAEYNKSVSLTVEQLKRDDN